MKQLTSKMKGSSRISCMISSGSIEFGIAADHVRHGSSMDYLKAADGLSGELVKHWGIVVRVGEIVSA